MELSLQLPVAAHLHQDALVERQPDKVEGLFHCGGHGDEGRRRAGVNDLGAREKEGKEPAKRFVLEPRILYK